MKRYPPLLGAVGIDFGYKPAISIVLPRKQDLRNAEDDEPLPSETCGCVCADMASTYTVTTEDAFLNEPVIVTADGGANEGCHWSGTDGEHTVDLTLIEDTPCFWRLSINEGIIFLDMALGECNPVGTYDNEGEDLHAVVS